MKASSIVSTAAVTGYVTAVVVAHAVAHPVGRDEHQFLASAFLVARHGLHPYRDFAYFHMPNLVYGFAPLYFTSIPFLLARLASALCAIGVCLSVLFASRTALAHCGRSIRLVVPPAAAVLLVHSPLFQHGTFYAWNHAPATLLALLAFGFHCRALRGPRATRDLLLSGAALGMAIGVRLSFAPLVVPFLLAIGIFGRGTLVPKTRHLLAFSAGGLLANLPALYFLVTDSRDLLFGNLGYANLNTLARSESGYSTAMTATSKLAFLGDLLTRPGELLLLAAIAASIVRLGVDLIAARDRPRFEVGFVALLLPFLLAGSLAPTPTFPQYYFALTPFAVLLGVYALAAVRPAVLGGYTTGIALLAIAVSFVVSLPPQRAELLRLVHPEQWTPVVLHREAADIRKWVAAVPGDEAVLTLSPIWAIEYGLPIFPEFATGPFGFRVSHLVSAQEARARGLPLRTQLSELIAERRPRAVLAEKGRDWMDEKLVEAAQAAGYRRVKSTSKAVVWLRPDGPLPGD